MRGRNVPPTAEIDAILGDVQTHATAYFEALAKLPADPDAAVQKGNELQEALQTLGLPNDQINVLMTELLAAVGLGQAEFMRRLSNVLGIVDDAQKQLLLQHPARLIGMQMRGSALEILLNGKAIEVFQEMRRLLVHAIERLSLLPLPITAYAYQEALKDAFGDTTLSDDTINALLPFLRLLTEKKAGPTIERQVSVILAKAVNIPDLIVPDAIQNSAWPELKNAVNNPPNPDPLPDALEGHLEDCMNEINAMTPYNEDNVAPIFVKHFGGGFFLRAELRQLTRCVSDAKAGGAVKQREKEREIYNIVLIASRRPQLEVPKLSEDNIETILNRMIERHAFSDEAVREVLIELFPTEWGSLSRDAPTQLQFHGQIIARVNRLRQKKGDPIFREMRTHVETALSEIRKAHEGAPTEAQCIDALNTAFPSTHPISQTLVRAIAGEILTLSRATPPLDVDRRISTHLANAVINRGYLVSAGVLNTPWNGLARAARHLPIVAAPVPPAPEATPAAIPTLQSTDIDRIADRMMEIGRNADLAVVLEQLFSVEWAGMNQPTRDLFVARARPAVAMVLERKGVEAFRGMRSQLENVARTLREREFYEGVNITMEIISIALRNALGALPRTRITVIENNFRRLFATAVLPADAIPQINTALAETVRDRGMLVPSDITDSDWTSLFRAAEAISQEGEQHPPLTMRQALHAWNLVVIDSTQEDADPWSRDMFQSIIERHFEAGAFAPAQMEQLYQILTGWRQLRDDHFATTRGEGEDLPLPEAPARPILQQAANASRQRFFEHRRHQRDARAGNGHGNGHGHGGSGHDAHGGGHGHGKHKETPLNATTSKPTVAPTQEGMQTGGIAGHTVAFIKKYLGSGKSEDHGKKDEGHH